MTAAEAGAVLLEEPDWRVYFDERVMDQKDDVPIELKEDAAFDLTLYEYRRFHFTWLPDGKRRPLDNTRAVIALAKLQIYAPRSIIKNVERTGTCFQEQHDDHCWLVNERAWRIVAMERPTMVLAAFGESKQIDYDRANWDKYVAMREEILK